MNSFCDTNIILHVHCVTELFCQLIKHFFSNWGRIYGIGNLFLSVTCTLWAVHRPTTFLFDGQHA